MDAIHRPLGAKSLDGVKRRTRAGMGRCQGGFCGPRVMELLARELGVPMTELTKSGGASRLLAGRDKGGDGMKACDVAIIGGGPAGLAAALRQGRQAQSRS